MSLVNKKYYIESFDNKVEVDWDNIPVAEIAENGWDGPKGIIAFAQLVFIKNTGFILKLASKETHPWANFKNDDETVCLDSCLEAFLSFDNKDYINLETNCLGVRLHGFGSDRYNRHLITSTSIKPIIKINSDSWSIIYEISLEYIHNIYPKLDISKIRSGFSFLGNFYKTGLNPTDGIAHYYMWNRIETAQPDFHQIGCFGQLFIK